MEQLPHLLPPHQQRAKEGFGERHDEPRRSAQDVSGLGLVTGWGASTAEWHGVTGCQGCALPQRDVRQVKHSSGWEGRAQHSREENAWRNTEDGQPSASSFGE